MSIVRIGLAETKKFSEGYEAIFGRKSPGEGAKSPAARVNKKPPRDKKKNKKKGRA